MKARDFITEKELETLWQIRDAVHEYLPIVNKWVNSGMPFNDHLQKAREQMDYIDNIISTFELQRP